MSKLTYVLQALTGIGMIGAAILMIFSIRLERHGLFIAQGCCFLVLAGLFYWQIIIRSSIQ